MNASIILIHYQTGLRIVVDSDIEGQFLLAGLPPGSYKISVDSTGYKPLENQTLHLEPSQTITIEINLSARETQNLSSAKILWIDYSHCIYQTALNEAQLQNSPISHNVWSLIENMDLSANTNRIDTGGLWNNYPALFSARGGTSWTQNHYLLNGMDITDPFETGKPLLFPDIYALEFTQMINAGHPPSALSPGGYFNLITQQPSDTFHGGLSAFYIQQSLQSSNITPGLQEEGLSESHGFDYLMDGNFHLSGPLVPQKIAFFTSFSAFDLSRDLADYNSLDRSTALSGLFTLSFKLPSSQLNLLWTGQILDYPSFGAKRYIPFTATLARKDQYHYMQAIFETRPHPHHFFKIGAGSNWGDIQSDFQDDLALPYSLNLFENIYTGAAPQTFNDHRKTLSLMVEGLSLFPGILGIKHQLQYGFQARFAESTSQIDIYKNLHIHYFNDAPLAVIKYNTPLERKESGKYLNFYLQDTLTLKNYLSFYVGFNLSRDKGWSPDIPETTHRIEWMNLSPRIGMIIPLNRAKTSAFRLSAARYYFSLRLQYLIYGNPNSLAGLVYSWEDLNKDNIFQEDEQGQLIRREGPYFAEIDPNIKRPYTDEIALSFSHASQSGWIFTIGGFFRSTKDLINTLNTGVPLSVYIPEYYIDLGDDRIKHTYDDRLFTVFNQNPDTLGQDFFLLTNADSGNKPTYYFGADIDLLKRFGDKFTFFFSLNAMEVTGTTNPGNTEYENDDGIIGTLYNDPNSLINSRGRLRFDRAYTSRLGFTYLAPFDIRLAAVLKYYDGQPFARKIIISGMNQGPFFIQATPRGETRYEFNSTFDIRIEKIFRFGSSQLHIILDGFNILNSSQATQENALTRADYLVRAATEIQSPRVFRLGLAYEF
ncbi:MAG: carboxypeptidase regulatory-like domain-containing protein [Candidatus Aminicenantes bacterium]|nr:carboxypeptidase regulatory-like domain-containing protein [Candidatus Aminicenantes bacterium]